MTQLYNFAEETCWKGEEFRAVRKKIMFRLLSVGRNLGTPFANEFEADYSLWYDQEDEHLIRHLFEVQPYIDWRQMAFHKKIDKSAIEIFETGDDRLVALVEVRGSRTRFPRDFDPSSSDNVLRFSDLAARREEIRARERAESGQSDGE